MNILYFNPNDGSFMSQWQGIHIIDELLHYDIHFELFNPLKYYSYEEANEELINRLKEDSSIDLFLNCASSEMLYKETMQIISRMPIPKLLICFDNLHAPFMHKAIAPYFDIVWLTSRENETMFKKWGCKTIFMPYAANPFAFKDLYKSDINKICFVGTPYGTRTMTFNHLAKNELNVDVFCKPNPQADNVIENCIRPLKLHKSWYDTIKATNEMLSFPIGRKVLYSRIKKSIMGTPNLVSSDSLCMEKKLSFYEMNRAYSNYALSLNIITLRNTAVLNNPVHKLHLRTFEIPMSAGLELVEYNEELASYFSTEEMVFYKDKDEMVDKARYYLNPQNASVCRTMKIKARQRAVNEHSWKNRFDKLLSFL